MCGHVARMTVNDPEEEDASSLCVGDDFWESDDWNEMSDRDLKSSNSMFSTAVDDEKVEALEYLEETPTDMHTLDVTPKASSSRIRRFFTPIRLMRTRGKSHTATLESLVAFIVKNGYCPRESTKVEPSERSLGRFLARLRKSDKRAPPWYEGTQAAWENGMSILMAVPNKQERDQAVRFLENIERWVLHAKRLDNVPPTTVACAMTRYSLSYNHALDVMRSAAFLASVACGSLPCAQAKYAMSISTKHGLSPRLKAHLAAKISCGISKRRSLRSS
jgi:hypothetical protein